MHPHPHPPPASPSQAHDRHAGHTPEMFRDRFLGGGKSQGGWRSGA